MTNEPQRTGEKSNWLNADALCKIIESAGKSRVLEISMEGLNIKFTSEAREPVTQSPNSLLSNFIKGPAPEDNFKMLDQADRDTGIDLGELMLADPYAYEQAITSEKT